MYVKCIACDNVSKIIRNSLKNRYKPEYVKISTINIKFRVTRETIVGRIQNETSRIRNVYIPAE